MKISREIKALIGAVMAATLSLGGAGVAAKVIAAMPAPTASSEGALSAEIAATPEMIAQGREFYGMSCSHCHADDATGDEGPTLHNLTISNARIATTIKKGVKGEMPAFAKKYDDAQVAALTAYLRTLR